MKFRIDSTSRLRPICHRVSRPRAFHAWKPCVASHSHLNARLGENTNEQIGIDDRSRAVVCKHNVIGGYGVSPSAISIRQRSSLALFFVASADTQHTWVPLVFPLSVSDTALAPRHIVVVVVGSSLVGESR